MRIISGKYKGKPLNSPSGKNIRPTADKVKQALFTKLQFFVENTTVLDLFCGSGSLGIEAISHGAKKVVFVDKAKSSICLTRENLSGLQCNVEVFNMSFDKFLNKTKDKFDLILVDPPYASGVYENVLKLIETNGLLNNDGYIVCEHPYGMDIKTNFIVVDKKRYGTVELTYFQQK